MFQLFIEGIIMNRRVLSLALCLLLSVSTVSLFSQEDDEDSPLKFKSNKVPYFFGLIGGVNQAMHQAEIATFADDDYCPFFENSSGIGFFGGAFVWIPIGDVKDSKHSIYVRATYNTFPSEFQKSGFTNEALVYSEGSDNAEVVRFTTDHTLDVTYNIFSIELLYKYIVIPNIGICVGPTFDFPVTKTSIQRLRIIDPANVSFIVPDPPKYRYEDGNRTIIVNDGDIPETESFRLAIKLGVQYEIITGTGFDIIPGLFYNFGVTKVSKSDDWRINAFQLGVDFRYRILL